MLTKITHRHCRSKTAERRTPIAPAIQKRFKFVGILAILIAAPAVIPIKFSANLERVSKSRTFLIVRQVSFGSTDAGNWLCIGDHNGFFENECFVVSLDGNSPARILSEDLYDHGETIFALYTEEPKELDVDAVNHIYCSEWDFVGDISRGSETIRIPYQNYITIYDLKFWDCLFSVRT